MIYTTLFLIGFLGILAMFFLGFVHVGNIGHATHGGHAHIGAHAGHAGHGQSHPQGGKAQGRDLTAGKFSSLFWSLLSPMTLFSLCLGAGITGMALKSTHLNGALTAFAACAGAVAFNWFVIQPMARLILGFASKPSKGLDGMVSQAVKAISHFDDSGKGLVQVNVDGQIVRVMAVLEEEDKSRSTVIQPGDNLTVTSVDGHKNICRVTRL